MNESKLPTLVLIAASFDNGSLLCTRGSSGNNLGS